MISLQPFLAAVEAEIANTTYGSEPRELYEPIEYIMSLGGKRMRPALTLIAASLFTDNWQIARKPAVAVEVFHNFTLMHDDIMDAAPLRRGQPTVHEKWNDSVAILSGDVMLVAAYDLLTDIQPSQFKRVIQRFNRTAAEVCEGQQLDMNFAGRMNVTEAEYLNMIRLKTSVLLGFALELGGIIAEADEESIALLYEAGVNMGIGFQLKDDLLDVYGDPEKFGKQVGGDIIENKKTWLLIKALEQVSGNSEQGTGNGEQVSINNKQSSLEVNNSELLNDGEAITSPRSGRGVGGDVLQFWLAATDFDKDEKVKAVTEIYNQLNIKQQAEAVVNQYFQKGLAAIDALNVPEARKRPLREFADFLISRES